MRKLLVIAALALMGTAAQAAEHYSFQIGGRTVRIEVPNRCNDISCIKVDIPGVNLGGTSDVPPLPTLPGQTTTTTPAPPGTGGLAPAPAQTVTAPPPPAPAVVPAPPPAVSAVAPAPPPPPPTVTAIAPATPAPATAGSTILPGALMPVGVWMTEKNEGRVRIEQCGQNLCGYAVEDRTNANGKQVLIDMKLSRENLWNGKINDIRSGSIYVSKMSLHGPNTLRVDGCAMGGMLCGGQTWTRTQ